MWSSIDHHHGTCPNVESPVALPLFLESPRLKWGEKNTMVSIIRVCMVQIITMPLSEINERLQQVNISEVCDDRVLLIILSEYIIRKRNY